MKIRSGSLFDGVISGLFLSGPIFSILLAPVMLCATFPHGMSWGDIGVLLFVSAAYLPITSVVGAIISLPVQLLGAWSMAALGDVYGWARCPRTWVAVGTTLGIIIALLFSDYLPVELALIGTSAICAWLCRRPLSWVEEADYVSPWARQF